MAGNTLLFFKITITPIGINGVLGVMYGYLLWHYFKTSFPEITGLQADSKKHTLVRMVSAGKLC